MEEGGGGGEKGGVEEKAETKKQKNKMMKEGRRRNQTTFNHRFSGHGTCLYCLSTAWTVWNTVTFFCYFFLLKSVNDLQ